ncbi:hypothetical protein SAMN05444392_102446 [Seinonella peptonophila]|uniref:Uncharacterized protein n=1 Tax=Seinonella peptonophila TaxID=112248 RepID=A0A1M4VNJ8_9BACL|nr:hypothetical protein [Seinonella peptonophila]SHE70420.1 hypothetical protein SAMN05444392_102446 [Seinonella peptonophila]
MSDHDLEASKKFLAVRQQRILQYMQKHKLAPSVNLEVYQLRIPKSHILNTEPKLDLIDKMILRIISKTESPMLLSFKKGTHRHLEDILKSLQASAEQKEPSIPIEQISNELIMIGLLSMPFVLPPTSDELARVLKVDEPLAEIESLIEVLNRPSLSAENRAELLKVLDELLDAQFHQYGNNISYFDRDMNPNMVQDLEMDRWLFNLWTITTNHKNADMIKIHRTLDSFKVFHPSSLFLDQLDDLLLYQPYFNEGSQERKLSILFEGLLPYRNTRLQVEAEQIISNILSEDVNRAPLTGLASVIAVMSSATDDKTEVSNATKYLQQLNRRLSRETFTEKQALNLAIDLSLLYQCTIFISDKYTNWNHKKIFDPNEHKSLLTRVFPHFIKLIEQLPNKLPNSVEENSAFYSLLAVSKLPFNQLLVPQFDIAEIYAYLSGMPPKADEKSLSIEEKQKVNRAIAPLFSPSLLDLKMEDREYIELFSHFISQCQLTNNRLKAKPEFLDHEWIKEIYDRLTKQALLLQIDLARYPFLNFFHKTQIKVDLPNHWNGIDMNRFNNETDSYPKIKAQSKNEQIKTKFDLFIKNHIQKNHPKDTAQLFRSLVQHLIITTWTKQTFDYTEPEALLALLIDPFTYTCSKADNPMQLSTIENCEQFFDEILNTGLTQDQTVISAAFQIGVLNKAIQIVRNQRKEPNANTNSPTQVFNKIIQFAQKQNTESVPSKVMALIPKPRNSSELLPQRSQRDQNIDQELDDLLKDSNAPFAKRISEIIEKTKTSSVSPQAQSLLEKECNILRNHLRQWQKEMINERKARQSDLSTLPPPESAENIISVLEINPVRDERGVYE